LLERFYSINRSTPPSSTENTEEKSSDVEESVSKIAIPETYWSVLPVAEDDEKLLLRGAVLVRILGKREILDVEGTEGKEELFAPLPPDLQAALEEPPRRPEKAIWDALKEDGLFTPAIISLALFFSTIAVLVEALLLQGMLQIGQTLGLTSQRIWAVVILFAFLLAPFILEFPLTSSILRMGRRLETRLRIAFLEKLPRLGDEYFRSRLTSDMAQRAYELRQLRFLPNLGFTILRTGFQLILTAIGVIWLDPISAPFAIIGTIFFIGLSFLTNPLLEEKSLRMRAQTAGLSRFYLDGLLGLVPIKTHSAERSVRRQHETHLYEWVRSGRDYYAIVSYIQSFGTLMYSLFSVAIVMNYIAKGGQSNEILLLFYWTLTLPALGQQLAASLQQYPMLRNRVFRLLEPLEAPDEETTWKVESHESNDEALQDNDLPAGIEMQNVSVLAGGHTILKNINLTIDGGEHIAIVGPSGAGKSSLIGLMLGWHRPAEGSIFLDGKLLDGRGVQILRQHTAWVDPAIQIWNRTLYDNLRYGSEYSDVHPMGTIIEDADLFDVLERLPDGLKTKLGEGGGLVSGGEGQRVRLGRAMLRQNVRLVLLDEPFRGLDREKRRNLLSAARKHWEDKTLLYVTHDVKETIAFARILVVDEGQIVEDGNPRKLAEDKNSRYYAILQAEEAVRELIWQGVNWRYWWIEGGRLTEQNDRNSIPTKDADKNN